MIVLGIILLVVSYFLLPIHILFALGILLVVLGVIVELFGALGHQIGPRRHYW